MKYICLVYNDEEKLLSMPDSELEGKISECMAYIGELEQNGQHVMSQGLQSSRTAAILRHRNGELSVTDGPFSETKEVLGGFTIIDARDLNEAIQIASRFPNGSVGMIEVRPVMDFESTFCEPVDIKIGSCLRRAAGQAPGCEDPAKEA